jgi:cytochrome c553
MEGLIVNAYIRREIERVRRRMRDEEAAMTAIFQLLDDEDGED